MALEGEILEDQEHKRPVEEACQQAHEAGSTYKDFVPHFNAH